MAKHKDDEWYGFWQNLKEGYDYFEVTRQPPPIDVCDKRYLINAAFIGGARPSPTGACPDYEKLRCADRAPRIHFRASAKQTKRTAGSASRSAAGSVCPLGRQRPRSIAFTLGPATPATPVPTPTKPVKAAAKAGPKPAAASKANAWSAAASTVTAEK